MSHSQLLEQTRLRVAIPLLEDPYIKLIDVAHELGDSDPAHFSRAFSRWVGITARDYRRQSKEGTAYADRK